jgi:hypothetical protein
MGHDLDADLGGLTAANYQPGSRRHEGQDCRAYIHHQGADIQKRRVSLDPADVPGYVSKVPGRLNPKSAWIPILERIAKGV